MSKEEVKGATLKQVYYCNHCDTFEVFENKESIEKHLSVCLMNPENKTPATSKHLVIEQYPPFPRFERKGRHPEVMGFIGKYNKAYDERTGEYIKEDDWFSEMDNWVEAERDITHGYYKAPVKVKTKEYEKFINTFSKPKGK